jgi:DMSO/TMAO reductase YedYZ heme-binding membrane subunit
MVESVFKWLTFLADRCPLLVSSIVLTGIFLLLAKSIKKHSARYYIAFAIPAILYFVQEVLLLTKTGSGFRGVPVIGELIREYVHASGFGFPLLVIIMYVGALPPQNVNVKKILMIRKELSIISGFPILVHSFVRIMHNLPASFEKQTWIKNGVGGGLSNASYLLGILMVVLFVVLWITSFDSIHKRLGAKKWKKIQNGSYVLYAMLFVHSILIHTGRMLSMGGGRARGKDVMLSSVIAIVSTSLIFGSYLILRLRKRKKDALRKKRND